VALSAVGQSSGSVRLIVAHASACCGELPLGEF